MQILGDLVAAVEALLAPLIRAIALLVPALLVMAFAYQPSGCSKEKAYIAAMRSDLRELAALQEERRAEGLVPLRVAPDSGSGAMSYGVTLVSIVPRVDGFHAVVAYPGGTNTRCEITHRWGADPAPSCDR